MQGLPLHYVKQKTRRSGVSDLEPGIFWFGVRDTRTSIIFCCRSFSKRFAVRQSDPFDCGFVTNNFLPVSGS